MIRLITASAGSGKTTTLAKVLDDAIGSDRVRTDAIIATTFTRHAAAELIERARVRLLESGRSHEAHQLLAARIGTVNSVCAGLVADFAFEAGLSPALRVLDEAAAELEQKRAFGGVVGTERAEAFAALASGFTTDLDWLQEVRRVIDAARANGIDEAGLFTCAQRSVESLDRCLGPCAAAGDTLDRELVAAIEEARATILGGPDNTDATADYVELMRHVADDVGRLRYRWGDWAKLCTTKVGKKSAAAVAPVVAAAARHVEHPRLRDELHRLIRLVFGVAADGLAAYQAHKRERGLIDFVDQETLALQLLRRADVRDALAGAIDLVLVDEFQDTSPIQLAIFLELASLAKESVWVGDQKQAIYGFRGTDPTLMDAVIESLTGTLNDPELVAATVAAVGSTSTMETLKTSYRSRPALVDLTNDLFAPAFARHGLPEERTRLEAQLTRAKEPPGLDQTVEYWPLIVDGRSTNARLAAAAATGVAELLASRPRVRDRASQLAREAGPADVAVLCRTNEQCRCVAEALADVGLPAIVPRLGLLDTAEGRTVLAGLRLWADGGDKLARAELARLGTFAGDLDGLVTHALTIAAGEAPFEREPAVTAILARRDLEPELDPAAVVGAVIDATELRTRAAGWGRAAQRLANLDTLRAHATAYAAAARAGREACTVVGLIAYLDRLVNVWGWRAARTDTQALLGGTDAITVSTWHAAKGREWPITILYGLESTREPTAIGLHVESDAAEVDLRTPLAGRWLRYWPLPYKTANQGGPVRAAYDGSAECERVGARGRREALRLLYVGWTRARDRLILAAKEGKLLDGLLGTLTALIPAALTEPRAERGNTVVTWAERRIGLYVRPVRPAEPVEAAATPGEVTVGLPGLPRGAYPPLRLLPSEASSLPCAVGSPIVIGPPLPLRGTPDMIMLGQAVHAFLAADRADLDPGERLALAADLLRRHGVESHLDACDVMDAGTRLWEWLAIGLGATRLHREWPVAERRATGTIVAGLADLVARLPSGYAVVDHKSIPGLLDTALTVLPQYSGQLAAYASAIRAATDALAVSTWIHLPLIGVVVELTPRLE